MSQAPAPAAATPTVAPLTLLQKQFRFSQMVAALVIVAVERGFQVTLGDAYRDPRVFGPMGVRKGYGQGRSAHKQRLAIDLNLFKDGQYLQGTEAHRELGLWWEAQGGCWGGRFEDGNHYSLEHEGVK
jgi:hypothetical protein